MDYPYELYEEGYVLALARQLIAPPTPADQIEMVAALFEDLMPILQPISLDLILGCSYLDTVLDDQDVAPQVRYWHLRQDPPPPDFKVHADVGEEALIARAPVLDPPTIAGWLQRPLEQRVPERATIIETLRMNDGRARLCTPSPAGSGVFEIHEGPGKYEIPVEHRADGSWVSGPRLNMLYPPIRFTFTNSRGALDCDFRVTWTRWATPGTYEYGLFCACVKKILASSWTISYQDDVFKPGLG